MKLIPTLLASAALCAGAQADLQIILQGTVYDISDPAPSGTAFDGAQVGNPVRLAFTVNALGTGSNQYSSYEVDPSFLDFQIGNGRIQSTAFASIPLFVENNGVPNGQDSVTGNLWIDSFGSLDIYVRDRSGQMLSTADLDQSLGSFVTPGSSFMWLHQAATLENITIDLDLMEVLELGPVGNTYCAPPVSNSTGQPALLSGFGSDIVSVNNLEMQATNLPRNQFALLLVGSQQSIILNPGNSQGNLCLGGGSIGRFTDQVAFSGTQGTASFQVDLNNMPALFGTIQVLAGETWNYQLWYRDQNPTSTTNYTNPVEVLFQ